MTVCAACGTENRDKARYCRGCAQPLLPQTPNAQPAAAEPAPRKKRRRPVEGAASASGTPWWKRPAAGWIVAVGLAAGGWLLWPSPAPVRVAPAPAAAPVPVPSTTSTLSLPSQSAPALSVAGAMPGTTTAAGPSMATPPATPPVATAPPVRSSVAERAASPPPRPPKPRPKAEPPATAADTATTAPAASAAPVPVATPPASPAAPTRGQTVDERCADRGNFFTRDVCRVQACRNPALAGDPVCVRFREMEELNRQRIGR